MTDVRIGGRRLGSPGGRWRIVVSGVVGCALLMLMHAASAQMAPRLTGEIAVGELEHAAAALSVQAKAHPNGPLVFTAAKLQGMAASLRQSLGSDAGKPVETIGKSDRAQVLRGHAAAMRAQAYLKACSACLGADASATTGALAAGIERLADASGVAKDVPVIDTVETLDHQPLFAVRAGGTAAGVALGGESLADTQCASPVVTATDVNGALLPIQPTLSGVLPTRLELHWPKLATLPPGLVVLHVVPQRKVFLLGCSTLPEATATFTVAPPLHLTVDYVLSARCGAATVELGHGAMPPLDGYGRTVSRNVDTSRCAAPESYTVSATVGLGDGTRTTVGPFTQNAGASITAGLPGGLSLSWNPSVQMLFVRSGKSPCKGIE